MFGRFHDITSLNGFASSTGSSRFRLANGQARTPQPLRSSPITGPSTLSGRRTRPLKGSPPSAAQTERAVFPHSAFMNGCALDIEGKAPVGDEGLQRVAA